MSISCHIGLTNNKRNGYRMWVYQNNSLYRGVNKIFNVI